MKNEQEIVRSVFNTYIREVKAISTKKDRPTFDMLEKVKNMAIKALEKPMQRWVPVSERLPDPQDDGDSNFTDWVQVSIKINPYQSIVCSAYYCFSEKKWYMERFACGEVMAWQPLPQPYEEK